MNKEYCSCGFKLGTLRTEYAHWPTLDNPRRDVVIHTWYTDKPHDEWGYWHQAEEGDMPV